MARQSIARPRASRPAKNQRRKLSAPRPARMRWPAHMPSSAGSTARTDAPVSSAWTSGDTAPVHFEPFEAAYQALTDKLRPQVFTLGFLR